MVNSLAKVSYGYTDKGNRYEKSSNGKKIGKYLGAGYGTAVASASLAATVNNSYRGILSPMKALKGFKSYVINEPTVSCSNKILDFIANNKSCRCAILGLVVTTVPFVYAGIGKLLGHGYDKIVDHFSMKKADKAAEAQKQ